MTDEPKDTKSTEETQAMELDPQPPGRLETTLMRFGVIGELLVQFATGDRWWMAPLVLLLGVLGLILALINSFKVVAPFIYMAF